MKLPRLRPRPAAETTEPAPGTAEPASASPAAPALLVLAYSKAGLPGQELSAQTEKLRSVASYDDDTRSGYAWLPLDHPERAAEVLTALFEAASAQRGGAAGDRPGRGCPAGAGPTTGGGAVMTGHGVQAAG